MATSTTQRGTSLIAGLVYFQLAAGMILFGSATPVSKIVTDAMPVFVGSTLSRKRVRPLREVCALGFRSQAAFLITDLMNQRSGLLEHLRPPRAVGQCFRPTEPESRLRRLSANHSAAARPQEQIGGVGNILVLCGGVARSRQCAAHAAIIQRKAPFISRFQEGSSGLP